MFYRSKLIPYALCVVLLVNYSVLAMNINDFLDEEAKTTEFDQKIGNSSLLENRRVKNIKTVRPSTWQDSQIDFKIQEEKWKEWAPPWTPPRGYLEDPVDAVTDYHAPSDNGTIDDWSQMQMTDGIYSNLTESYISGNQATSWYSPSAYENNFGWSYPARMYVSDNSRASFNYDNENVVLYNFTLPDLSSYTIVGIEVRLEGYEYGSAYVDIALLWNARSNETSTKRIYLSASEYYQAVGGATDTWGQTWSSADLSNANFGVKLTGQVGYQTTGYVDHVQVRIYYQAESGNEFDREFSFEDGAVYDEGLELAIKTGQISNESLNVDMWNASSSSWFNILNINDIDDYTWKNVSLSSYLPTSDSNLHFRFVDTTFVGDSYSNTWQIDSILIRYRLLSRYFLNRKNITIDHTQVAGPLTNFPVLIDLYDTDLHDDVQADGDDIIFTTPAGIKLAHQLEVFNQTYNNSYAHLLVWVKLPSLSSTINTNISMYYTNTTIGTQEQPPSTWNEDFLAVWHLNETVTDEGTAVGVHLDSTWNTYDGDQDGNNNNIGFIGQGQAFDGTDDLVNITAAKNLDPSADVTLSGWFKLDTTYSSASSTSLLIMGKHLDIYDTMHIVLVGTDYVGAAVPKGVLVFKVESNNEKYYKWTQQTTWAADTWYYFACTLDASNPENNKIYINGVDDTSSADLDYANNALNLAYNADWGIGGGLTDDGNLPAGEAWFDGVLDEMRVATTIHTAAWIATEFNNQNNPAGFHSIRGEERMVDLDPPTLVDFGVIDPGDGQPHFWANVTDDFSGVFNVTLNLNGTEQVMTLNATGYWVYYPLSVNFNDYFTYQIVNASDNLGRFLSTSSEVKNITFDYDNVSPSVVDWEYYPDIHPPEGTFNANVSDLWGEGISTVIVNVTDVNGLPTAYWAYMRNTSSGYINNTLSFPRASVIEFVIFVNDTAGNTNTSTPHIGYVGANNAPIAENLTLIPDPVRSNETLRLRYDYYDDQNDPQAGTIIRWYKNGDLNFTEPIYGPPGTTYSSELPTSYLIKDDQWYVTVTPKDWKEYGPVNTSATITIQNSAPTLTSYFITPSQAYTTSTLNCTYAYFDNDNDLENITSREIQWYRNSTYQPALDDFLTVAAALTKKGETWYFRLRVHDGEEYSTWYQSAPLVIANSPPTAAGLNIFNAGNLYTDDDLVANWTFSDVDINDTQASYLIQWYRNGMHQPGLDNLMTVDSSFTTRGESWYFTLQVSDGVDLSIVYTLSTSVIILNTPPVAGNLTLTLDPTSADDLVAGWDYFDLDGDSQSTQWLIQWFRNDVHQATLDDRQTVAASYTSKGEVWYYELRVHDGTAYSLVYTSDSTVIQNTPPSIANIRFGDPNPEFVVEGEVLTVNYTFVDPDFDPDQSIIYWYCDDVRQDQYTNWTSLPVSGLSPGEVWRVEVLPYDGEVTGSVVQSTTIIVESQPKVIDYGITPQNTTEGVYSFWINVTDELGKSIEGVSARIFIVGLNNRSVIRVFDASGTEGIYILEDLPLLTILENLGYSKEDFASLLHTIVLIEVTMVADVPYSEVNVEGSHLFSLTIEDTAAPRVIEANYELDPFNPTQLIFWAYIEEYGAGIDEVILYYKMVNATDDTSGTKYQALVGYSQVLMTSNGTHYLVTITLAFSGDYDISFTIKASDQAGNVNDYEKSVVKRSFSYNPLPIDLGLLLLIVGIIIAVIGVGAVVAVRRFSGTELVGLDIDRVMSTIAQVDEHTIETTLDDHTLGIVISFFDQRHGPVPIMVEPPILKDNFATLIELSDLAFSSGRFARNFEEEVFSFFDFFVGMDTNTVSFTFSFALERPEARGGAENITLNIVVHKPHNDLVSQFIKQLIDPVHEIHILMDKSPSEKDVITNKIVELRRLITTIILAYEDMYGSVKASEDEEEKTIP